MKRKVLFVCLGNICRSPLAEAVFNDQIAKAGLETQFEADSCGTANYHVGDPPDPRTIRTAHKNGIPIQHVGRQLARQDFERFDHILVMDASNYQNTIQRAPEELHHKVELMRHYDPDGPGRDVPDPYYGDERDFQQVLEILDRSIAQFIARQQGSSAAPAR